MTTIPDHVNDAAQAMFDKWGGDEASRAGYVDMAKTLDALGLLRRDDHDDLSRQADQLQRVLEIHPADFDLQTRGRAFEEALLVRGHGELAAAIRVLVELLTGTLPCGHEPAGPPVDGREVDRAPDVVFVPGIPADMLPPPVHVAEYRLDDYRQTWYCRCPLLEDHISLTPKTDGGVPTDPPRASTPSSPHDGHTIPIPGPVEVGHWWLREGKARVPCYCLIGDDHVAEPRFEKEES